MQDPGNSRGADAILGRAGDRFRVQGFVALGLLAYGFLVLPGFDGFESRLQSLAACA